MASPVIVMGSMALKFPSSAQRPVIAAGSRSRSGLRSIIGYNDRYLRHQTIRLNSSFKGEMMQCPFCKEEIIDGAIKCKHCGSVIGDARQPQTAAQPDFASLFGSAAALWKENLADLVLLTLVFMLVVWIPIANFGFIAGYTRSLLRVARGEGKARVGDIFRAWDCFANLFLFFLINLIICLVLHFVPFFGTLASLIIGFVLLPGAFLIIDKGAGAIDAYTWCFATIQADFVNWLLAYVVGNAIIFAGFLVLFIGILLTAPLGYLIFIHQYERVKPKAAARNA